MPRIFHSDRGLLGRFARELECTVADDLIIFNDVAHQNANAPGHRDEPAAANFSITVALLS